MQLFTVLLINVPLPVIATKMQISLTPKELFSLLFQVHCNRNASTYQINSITEILFAQYTNFFIDT